MHALFIVHDRLIHSPESIDYIRRHYEKATRPVALQSLMRESDPELPLMLARLTEMSGQLLIVTSKKGLAPVGRMLATLTEDELTHKEGLVFPSRADVYDEDGYRIRNGECDIQVLRMEFGDEPSAILLGSKPAVLTLHLFGMEPDDAHTLLGSAAARHHVSLLGYPHVGGWSVLDVTATKESAIEGFLEETAMFLRGKVCAGHSVAEHLVERLGELGKTFTCAESCTGGRIASLITGVSGSSAVFDGSMVTYANRMKSDWIRVNETSLIAYGAVSAPVVEEMAAGILDASGADYSVAVSGIAGPGGGSIEKPVGTVYIAAAGRETGVRSERLTLTGDRAHIQNASAHHALRLLLETCNELI